MPSERLRKLEVEANHAFDQYRDMYFEGGVSSVYLWDLEHGFAGMFFCMAAIARSATTIADKCLKSLRQLEGGVS